MKLNIKQIEVFAAVMEHGSTTTAALHLRISQPSVSKHLKLLEASSGVNLFIRNNNRLLPTAEALALYDEIKRTYVGITHLENFVKNLSGEVKYEIGIGSMPSLSYKWLPQVVTGFLRKYDHYSVSILISTTQTIGAWVASGRVDLGFCMEMGDNVGVKQELLMQLPLVCVLPSGHSKAGQSLIHSGDLNGETLITLTQVDDWKSEKEDWRLAVKNKLDSDKVKPRNVISVSTSHVACEFVSCGSGVALVPALEALDYEQRGLKWLPFDLDYKFDIYLVQPKASRETRLISSFLDELRQEAGKLDAEIRSRYLAFNQAMPARTQAS